MGDFRYSKYEPFFGSWYITKQIGQGSIGQVFEIEREDSGHKYKAALKCISIPDSPDEIQNVLFSGVGREELPAYFNRIKDDLLVEIQFLAKLKGHMTIMNYEDHMLVPHEDGIGWDILIKTELLTPLLEYSLEHPLEEADVIMLGIEICRALESCGKYGIIHRDIKPENIFVTESGDFKLGDFGVAKLVEGTRYSVSRKGTYSYMAPEVFHGDSYGPSADLYSLGLVLYRYLNHNRSPFMPRYPEKIAPDDMDKAFIKRIATKSMPAPMQGSAKLGQIVLKACAHDSKDRYRSATDMRHDLEKVWTNQEHKMFGRSKLESSDIPLSSKLELLALGFKTNKTYRRKLLSRLLAGVIALAGITIYAMIPKDVEDIAGLDEAITMYYDGSTELDCVAKPDWFKNEPITYTSSDDEVFTVSEDGVLTAETTGKATLTATAKEYSETVDVSVVTKVTSIEGVDDSYSLAIGASSQLQPTLKPEKFEDEKIKYSSTDESIVAVSKDGVITAIGVGEAKVRIKAGGFTRTVKVETYQPVVYSAPAKKTSSKKSSKTSNEKTVTTSNGGYFSSSDDEYF